MIRRLRENLVLVLGVLVLLYTFVPIFIVVLMSFNAPRSRLVYRFDGFTLDNWLHPCADPSQTLYYLRLIEHEMPRLVGEYNDLIGQLDI